MHPGALKNKCKGGEKVPNLFIYVKVSGIIIFWASYGLFSSVWTCVCTSDASEHPPARGSATRAGSSEAINWQIPSWWGELLM